MSSNANTVAAWVGAIGVILTWIVKFISYLYNRRTDIKVKLLDGPKLKIINRSTIPEDIQPPIWGTCSWGIIGTPDGVKEIPDSEGNYIKLDPKAELTVALLPENNTFVRPTLRLVTATRLLDEHDEALFVCRRDGKVLHKILCQDIKTKIQNRLSDLK